MTHGNAAAFARPIGNITSEEFNHDQEGLTKKEYFAAKAMQALAQAWPKNSPENIATNAVRYANALIEALNEDKT